MVESCQQTICLLSFDLSGELWKHSLPLVFVATESVVQRDNFSWLLHQNFFCGSFWSQSSVCVRGSHTHCFVVFSPHRLSRMWHLWGQRSFLGSFAGPWPVWFADQWWYTALLNTFLCILSRQLTGFIVLFGRSGQFFLSLRQLFLWQLTVWITWIAWSV